MDSAGSLCTRTEVSQGRDNWHEHPALRLRQIEEPVALVEPPGIIILRIDHHSEAGKVCARRARYRISKQHGADLAAPKRHRDGQPTKQYGGNAGIVRELGRYGIWQFLQEDAGSRQRVISGQRRGRRFNDHKATCNAPADVLRGLLLEVSVQRCDATREGRSIMGACQGDDDKRRIGHSCFTSRRWCSKARLKAATGSGGSIRAAAKRSDASRDRRVTSISAMSFCTASRSVAVT